MPLHFGKIGAAIALLTIAAFVLWLLWTTLFATEQAEQKLEQHGAVELSRGAAGWADAERGERDLPSRYRASVLSPLTRPSTTAQATSQKNVAMATAIAAPSTP